MQSAGRSSWVSKLTHQPRGCLFIQLLAALLALAVCRLLSASAECSISPPSHGVLGSCSAILPAGSECSVQCQAGFILFPAATRCDEHSMLTAQTCDPCEEGSIWQWTPTMPLRKYSGRNASDEAMQGTSAVLSADGRTLLFGGPCDGEQCAGSAWVLQLNGSSSGGDFVQRQAKFAGAGGSGSAVAASSDGTLLAVGSPYKNGTGSVQLFQRSASTELYSPLAMLVPPATKSSAGSAFGSSISMSASGDVIAVGAPQDDSSIGAAFIFERDAASGLFTLAGKLLASDSSGSTPTQGTAVSLSASGDVIAVGAPADDGTGARGRWPGAVYIFSRSRAGKNYSELQAKLIGAGDDGTNQYQGAALSLSGDGLTLAVGATGTNSLVGGVFIFSRPDSTSLFSQQGSMLVGSGWSLGSNYFIAQGCAVSLSFLGDRLAVGGYGDESTTGATWLFARIGDAWQQQGQKLTNNDAIGAAQQGSAVSLSADGMSLAIGAQRDGRMEVTQTGAGAVWAGTMQTTCVPCSTLSDSHCAKPLLLQQQRRHADGVSRRARHVAIDEQLRKRLEEQQ